MANTVFRVLRTTTANKVPNTVNLPNEGQFALNMTDQVLYSRDTGTNIFAIGNNLPTMHVGNSSTSLLTVGNSSVNSLVVNTYISGNGYGITSVTATAAPGGANTNIQFNDSATTAGDANLTWNKTTAKFTVGNSSVNATANSTVISVNGTIQSSNIMICGVPTPFTTPLIVNGLQAPNFIYQDNTYNVFRIGSQGTSGSTSICFQLPASGANYQDVVSISGSNFTPAAAFDNALSLGLPTARWSNGCFGSQLSVGNSTVNVAANTTTIALGNTTGFSVTSPSIIIGNSSVNTFINSSAVLINGLPVGGAPGGSNTYIQFNDSAALGGDANFAWDKTTDTLTVGNSTINVNINTTSIDVGAINTTAVGLILANTSLKIGNSSVNASINSTAFTGTSNNSTYFNGETVNAFFSTKSIDILGPTAGDVYTLFWTNTNISIAEIVTGLANTTATAWVNTTFSWTANLKAAGTTILTSNCANDTLGTHTTSLTNSTPTANSFIRCKIEALSNATEFHATLRLS